MKNNKLGAHDFLVTSIFKPLKVVKSGPIFDQATNLGKASRDAYNPGLLLILYDLLEIGLPKVSLPTLMTLAIIIRDRPRFFDQIGH